MWPVPNYTACDKDVCKQPAQSCYIKTELSRVESMSSRLQVRYPYDYTTLTSNSLIEDESFQPIDYTGIENACNDQMTK